MVFKQETALKSIDPLDVIRSFHTYRFVEYLTFGQPVKIENWRGIDDGKTASFSFWFFGWRRISVIHQRYILKRFNFSYFKEQFCKYKKIKQFVNIKKIKDFIRYLSILCFFVLL